MNIVLDEDRATLIHGNSKDLDGALGENTVDAVVCDPPAGIGFMGKDWDDYGKVVRGGVRSDDPKKGTKGILPGYGRGGTQEDRRKWAVRARDGFITAMQPVFTQMLRALKPGGYALVWALPRTSHWTATALELAGFEIRDVHHDILAADEAVQAFVASLDEVQRQALARILESQTTPAVFYHLFGTGFPKSLTSKSAEIPEWSGSALKPAVEHWILARKPLDGSYAENFKKWGTGVLNIEGCRVEGTAASFHNGTAKHGNSFGGGTRGEWNPTKDGRWPAHLSLDEEGAKALDEQSGIVGCGNATAPPKRTRKTKTADFAMAPGQRRAGKEPGASRFFYVAKAPRKEKDAGLDHLPARSGGQATDREDGSAGLTNPRAGAGRTGGAKNFHPTVKNLALMKWLVRLVTPPGGIVLDPFAGSGTTGVAALQEGFSFIGVEEGGKDGEYLPILLGRIRHALGMSPDPDASTPR